MPYSVTGMRRFVLVLALSSLALGSGAVRQQELDGPIEGVSQAPKFTLVGTDNKTYESNKLLAKGPVLFYFIKRGCPINEQALPQFVKLGKAYQKSVRVVGITNQSLSNAKEWKEEFQYPFLLLSDNLRQTIWAFGAGHSPWLVLTDSTGRFDFTLKSISNENLQLLSARMAELGGVKNANLQFDYEGPEHGCNF